MYTNPENTNIRILFTWKYCCVFCGFFFKNTMCEIMILFENHVKMVKCEEMEERRKINLNVNSCEYHSIYFTAM